MEEKMTIINESLNAIRSKHNRMLVLSYLPIKKLFPLVKYSKQYQTMLAITLKDFKFIYNYYRNPSNERHYALVRELNIKLRLEIDDTASNYNTLKFQTLFQSQTHHISSVLILKDKRMALGTAKGQILLSASVPRLTFLDIIDAHAAKVTSLIQLSNDSNNTMASSSIDKTLKLWNIKKLEVIFQLEFIKPVHSLLEFSPELIIAGSNELVVMNTVNLGEYHTLKQHYGTVYSLMKGNQTDLIIGSSRLKIFHFCNNKAALYSNYKEYISVFEGKAFAVRACLLLEGNRIASAEDAVITIWDIQAKAILYKLCGHTKSIFALELIDADADAFASGGEDFLIIVWNINDFSKSKLIYTCLTSCILKIVYTEEKELTVFSSEGKIITFHQDRSNDEDGDGTLFDFYTQDGKLKKMIKINNSNQLTKLICNENQE